MFLHRNKIFLVYNAELDFQNFLIIMFHVSPIMEINLPKNIKFAQTAKM